MKKILSFIFTILLALSLSACSKKEGPHTITVGTIAGPETDLMQVAKQVALKKYGLTLKIVTFSDYITPNIALSQGNIDANAYQHLPFLKDQIKQRGYQFVSVGKTFVFPMGLYSSKLKSLSQLKSGAQVAIPNDPSNEARALLLLQKAKLIKLKPGVDINATPQDVISNPKKLKFIELDGPELPRTLNDVSLAAINTTFAIPAGLKLKQALIHEGTDSLYANIMVVRTEDRNLPKVKQLVKAYQSAAVRQKAKQLFGDAAIAAW